MSDGPALPAPRAPFSSRSVDVACLVLAVWTLCCHAAVVAGGSLRVVLGLFAGSAVGWASWRFLRRAPEPTLAAPPAEPPRQRNGKLGRARVAGLALGVLGAVALPGHPLALWCAAVSLLLLAALLYVFSERPSTRAPVAGRALEVGLWGMGLACAAIALTSHRVDIDDSFYVNLAVAAVDAPATALFAGDTLHGIPSLPLHLPVYRVHSWELWNAALSRLSGIPAIASFHLLSAGMVGLLVPLALARLFRQLVPQHWLWAVAAALWVLLVAGDVHHWYGNFAFVRMWQGKAVFLSVLLPLVYAYAVDFALHPTRRRWLLLAAVQVASLGCTSSAIWAAPAASLAAAASALHPDRRGLRRLGFAGLASVYVLGAGVVVKLDLDAGERETRGRMAVAERLAEDEQRLERRAELHRPGRQLEEGLLEVTGSGALRGVCVAALLAAWACCGPGLGRRFAIVVPLAATGVLLNPWASEWIGRNIVGPSGWRAFWALPIPLLLALVLTAPLELSRRVWVGRVAALLALLLFGLAPSHPALSFENQVELGWPRLKVPPKAYGFARIFIEQVPTGSAVVAPLPLAVWLPTFHERVHPLVVRDIYLRPYRELLGREDLQLRGSMSRYVAGEIADPSFARWFARGLERYDIRGVFLYRTDATRPTHRVLREAGFARTLATLEYEVWVRS